MKKLIIASVILLAVKSNAGGIPVIDKTHIAKQLAEFVEQMQRWKATTAHWAEQYEGAGMGSTVTGKKLFKGIELVAPEDVSDLINSSQVGEYIQKINEIYKIDEDVLASAEADEDMSSALQVINDARSANVQLQQLKDKADYRIKKLIDTQQSIAKAVNVKNRQSLDIRSNTEVGYTNIALMKAVIATAEQQSKRELRKAQSVENQLKVSQDNMPYIQGIIDEQQAILESNE